MFMVNNPYTVVGHLLLLFVIVINKNNQKIIIQKKNYKSNNIKDCNIYNKLILDVKNK